MSLAIRAKLAVDVGNSSTKVILLHRPEGSEQNWERVSMNLSNHYAEFDESIPLSDAITADNSAVFQVKDNLLGNATLSGTYVNGVLADREYSDRLILPTAKKPKYTQKTYAFALNIVFARSFLALASHYGVSVDNIASELAVTWEVYTLLPPGSVGKSGDERSGSAIIKNLIHSIDTVDFSFPKVYSPVVIDTAKTKVIPECYAAYLGYILTEDLKPRPGYHHLPTSTVLIVDSGAGTTDMLIMQNNSRIESTNFTINVGGNDVALETSKGITEKYRFEPSTFAVSQAVRTGYLKMGAENVSVAEQISKAHRIVASKLVNNIRTFVESSPVNMNDINYLILVGGGTMDNGISNVRPLGEFMTEELQEYAPFIQVVDPPKTVVDGVPMVESPREFNIKGASILAMTQS